MRLYRVLSSSKRKSDSFIVDYKGSNKSEALTKAKNERGWYWGISDYSTHHKVGKTLFDVPKEYRKKGNLYRVYSRVR